MTKIKGVVVVWCKFQERHLQPSPACIKCQSNGQNGQCVPFERFLRDGHKVKGAQS